MLCVTLVWLLGESRAAETDELPPEIPAIVLEAQQARIDAIARAARASVAVFGLEGDGGGSGVIVTEDGYVVTNYHVSSPFGETMRCGLSDGRMIDAVLVSIDPTGDLAMLKLLAPGPFPTATLGDSDQVQIGQWCFAIGNPFVLATNLQPTVTWGLVSGTGRYQYPAGTILEYSDCIQTDAAINPGNSGGPLFSAAGELIGINGRCSFEKRGRVNVGVGYAISINQVKRFMGDLRSGRVVDHATLGFTAATDSQRRVVVSNILSSCDAYRRGLRVGDQIVSLDGQPIDTVNRLKNITGTLPRHWRPELTFIPSRKGAEPIETVIRLEPLHSRKRLAEIVQGGLGGPPPRRLEPPQPAPDKTPQDLPTDGPSDPAPDRPDDDPSDDPEQSVRRRFADFIELREGFANYHFNRVELDRVLALRPSWSAATTADGPPTWLISGQLLAESTPAELHLAPGGASFGLVDGPPQAAQTKRFATAVLAQDPAALAIGWKLWQRWMLDGPQRMGEAVYIGESRLVTTGELMDLVLITVDDVEVRCYSDPQLGQLRLIEIEADSESDPAEIYFDYPDPTSSMPDRSRLMFGNQYAIGFQAVELTTIDPAQLPPPLRLNSGEQP
jgi:serine protease Do